MRILLVSDFLPPTHGGMESHVQRLARALIYDGHDVAAVSGTMNPDPLPSGATPYHAPTVLSKAPQVFRDRARHYHPPFPDPVFSRTVRRVAYSWQPDVIHAHGWCAFSCYWPGSPPLVVTLHDHGLRCPKRSLLRHGAECVKGSGMRCATCPGDQPAAKRIALAAAMQKSVPGLAAHADCFIAVSRSVASRIAEIGFSGPAVRIIPNFFDTRSIAPSANGDQPGQPTVLFVGPDNLHKGRSIAIAAFRLLPASTARLVLVGGGAPVNMEGVSTLGYLQGSALREQYSAASVALVPSIWPEPCPTVALEAMAHGVPVIGSRIGGIPDIVEHGSSGLLVRPNDVGSLAGSMRTVLTDHDLRRRLGEGARAQALHFDTAVVVPKIVETYDWLLRKGP